MPRVILRRDGRLVNAIAQTAMDPDTRTPGPADGTGRTYRTQRAAEPST